MPKVELIGGRSVALQPVPAPFDRRTPSPNEFGAQLGQGLGRLGDLLTAHAIKARSDADQVAALSAGNALEQFIQTREFDPTTGYLSQHGDEVWDLPERAAAEVNKEADRIFSGIANERVKQSFLVARGSALQSLDMRLRRHVLKEVEAQDIAVTQATVDLATASSINNALSPEFIRPEIDRIVGARRDFAERWGINKDILEAQISEEVSAVHVGVITRLLELGNDTQANDYFQVVGPGPDGADEINGTALIVVEKALKEGTLRGITQQTTDQIMATCTSITECFAEARTIENPELRGAVEDEVGIRLNQREAAAAENKKATNLRALQAVKANPLLGVKAIDPATWASMDINVSAALNRYAEAQAPGGGGTETDAATYYGLFQSAHGVRLPGDERTAEQVQSEFADFDLMTVRHLLDEVDWERLVALQGQIALGKKSTDVVFDDGRSQTQIFNGALDKAGVKRTGALSTKQRQRLGLLNEQHAAGIRRWQEDNEKKAPNEVKQQIMDTLLIEVTIGAAGGFAASLPGIGRFFAPETQRVTEVLGTIPEKDKVEIRAALRETGQAPTNLNVVNEWLSFTPAEQSKRIAAGK